MNIPVKQHPTIKKFSPITGTPWFIRRIVVDALLSRVGLHQHPEEEHPDDESMPIALVFLLRRIDELAAHHTALEQCIGQIERECQKRNRHLSFPGHWGRSAKAEADKKRGATSA